MYKKGLIFINSKYGIATSLMCGLFLIPLGLYTLKTNIEQADSLRISYSLFTIGLGITNVLGSFVRARKMKI